MSSKQRILAIAFAVTIATVGVTGATPTHASKVCFGTLSILPGQQITATRDGKYRHNGRCYAILECPTGKLAQSGARLFTCHRKANIACTYDAYTGGACSYKQHQAYKSKRAASAPASCNNKLTVKVGQGFKTNARNQFVYANKCYGTFECDGGDLKRVSSNSYVCYASVSTVQPVSNDTKALAGASGPRAPICRYVDYSEGKCTYDDYVRDYKKTQ